MTDEARLDELVKLRAASEDACKWAYHERRKIKGAVNWADLGPYEVRWWIGSDGDSGYEVLIEEAAPDAWEFCQFVHAYLTKRGFRAVEVRTEW